MKDPRPRAKPCTSIVRCTVHNDQGKRPSFTFLWSPSSPETLLGVHVLPAGICVNLGELWIFVVFSY